MKRANNSINLTRNKRCLVLALVVTRAGYAKRWAYDDSRSCGAITLKYNWRNRGNSNRCRGRKNSEQLSFRKTEKWIRDTPGETELSKDGKGRYQNLEM